MNSRSPLHQLVRVIRDFGFPVAVRVTYSKVRGWLFPSLALPDTPFYAVRRREVSFLLSTAEQEPATLKAVIEVVAARTEKDWEVCICERSPANPEMARALDRLRGTQPWIRIVTADRSVDDATAARWTVEQATGQFVALVAARHAPAAEAIAKLVAHLRHETSINAAVLSAGAARSGNSSLPASWRDCQLLLQTKSRYLATFPGRWRLSAAALARELEEAGAPTANMAEAPP